MWTVASRLLTCCCGISYSTAEHFFRARTRRPHPPKKIRGGGMSLLLSADAENPIQASGACKVQEGRSSSATRRTELITEYCGTTANYCYLASAAVAVDSSHMAASSSDSWTRFSPPSNFVNGHVSTMCFMVCPWPQSQEGDLARPHLCKLARHGPCPVRKQFIRDHV